MRLELKLGKTGREIIGFINGLLFAYLGVVFSFRISYSNPILFDAYRFNFLIVVFLGYAITRVIGEIARRVGVRY